MNPETEKIDEVQDRPVFTATTRLNAALQQEAATALTPPTGIRMTTPPDSMSRISSSSLTTAAPATRPVFSVRR